MSSRPPPTSRLWVDSWTESRSQGDWRSNQEGSGHVAGVGRGGNVQSPWPLGTPVPSALVTGASRGIGAAVAKRLARDGFDVALHYHQDRAGVDATRKAVEKEGRTAEVLQADLADPTSAWHVAREATNVWGKLDAFVANAGLYDRRSLADMTGDAWRQTLAVDLDAPAVMAQALLPNLGPSASLVFVSSIVASRGTPHGAHYAAAKAGLVGLTRALALELAPKVRVNAVAPGYVDTDMIDGDSPERRAGREQEVPLGRVGSPEDVAGAVSWLCGPDSAYVTGQLLHINGGLWMG